MCKGKKQKEKMFAIRKKTWKRRLVSLMMATTLTLGMFPVTAFADDAVNDVQTQTEDTDTGDESQSYIETDAGVNSVINLETEDENLAGEDSSSQEDTEETGTDVAYVDANGALQTATGVKELESALNYQIADESDNDKNNALLESGWYVVNGESDIDMNIKVEGDVHLILADGCTLNANRGINVSNGYSITIYAQSAGTGILNATGGTSPEGINQAGIGAGSGTKITNSGSDYVNVRCGDITINGGNLNVTGAYGAPGIGGGYFVSANHITINGGNVNVTSGESGAAIGGGFYGSGGYVAINGGTVHTTVANGYWGNGVSVGRGAHGYNSGTFTIKGNAKLYADTIGDTSSKSSWSGIIYQGSTVTVYGEQTFGTDFTIDEDENLAMGGNATLTLAADYTIDEGETFTVPSGTTLIIQEGVTLTNNGTIVYTDENQIINNGTITGNKALVTASYLNDYGSTRTANAMVLTKDCLDKENVLSGNSSSSGWYVVTGDLEISDTIKISGDVKLILANDCNLQALAGIEVEEGNSLTISSPSGGTGILDAGKNGIGGGGDIIINAGIITSSSAGISGPVTVNGGTVITNGLGDESNAPNINNGVVENTSETPINTANKESWCGIVIENNVGEVYDYVEMTNSYTNENVTLNLSNDLSDDLYIPDGVELNVNEINAETSIDCCGKISVKDKLVTDSYIYGDDDNIEGDVYGKLSFQNWDDVDITSEILSGDTLEGGYIKAGSTLRFTATPESYNRSVYYWCVEPINYFRADSTNPNVFDYTMPAGSIVVYAYAEEVEHTHRWVLADADNADSVLTELDSLLKRKYSITASNDSEESDDEDNSQEAYESELAQYKEALSAEGIKLICLGDAACGEDGELCRVGGTLNVNATGKTYDGTAITEATVSGFDDVVEYYSSATGLTELPDITYETSQGEVLEAAPEDAGSYKAVLSITYKQGGEEKTVTASEDFDIKQKDITVTAEEKSKVYGDSDPDLTYTVDGLLEGENAEDLFTGALEREKGNNAGKYEISQGTLALKDGSNYNIKTFVSSELEIKKADPELTVDTSISKTYGDDLFEISASRSGDGVLSYTSDNDKVLKVDGDGNAVITGAGEAIITVKLAESDNYISDSKTITVNVAKRNGNLTISEVTYDVTYGDEDFDIAYSVAENNGMTFTSNNESVAAVDDDGKVTITGVGEATITIASDGSANYKADTKEVKINVAQASIAGANIELALPDDGYSYDGKEKKPEVESVITSTGLSLTKGTDYTVDYEDNINAGTAVVIVNAVEDGNYTGSATTEFTITKGTPGLTVASVADKTYGDEDFELEVKYNGSGKISYASSDENILKVDTNGKVNIVSAGKAAVTVSVAADSNYNSDEENVNITVNKSATAPDAPGSTFTPEHTVKTVSAIELPVGWQWSDADKDTELADNESVKATAKYIGADAGNYEIESVEITITRQSCSHKGGTATCKDLAKCEICGEEYGELDLTTHTGGTANCVSGAICENCGAEYTEKNAENHTGKTKVVNKKVATCTEKGYTGDTLCGDCETVLETGTEISATGHTGGTATCKDLAKCEICGEEYGELDLTAHTGGTANCVSGAICEICGVEYTEKNAENHTGKTKVVNKKAATCTENGYTGNTVCTDCETVLETGTEISATGHTGGTATCKDFAKCEICGEEYGELDLTTHTGGTATCAKKAICTVCGEEYGELLDHSYTSEITKESSDTEEGVRTYTCENCGYSYTDSIPKVEPPYIEGEDGKHGWDVIRSKTDEVIEEALENPDEDNTVNVVMNGAYTVPGDIFEKIKGQEVTVVFDMGDGIKWSVDGNTVSGDDIDNINLKVHTDEDEVDIPEELVENVINNAKNVQYIQKISLEHDGPFGFTAVMSIELKKEDAGCYANLFYYNRDENKMEFMSSGIISEDGTTNLEFVHASEYVIVVDAESLAPEEETAIEEPTTTEPTTTEPTTTEPTTEPTTTEPTTETEVKIGEESTSSTEQPTTAATTDVTTTTAEVIAPPADVTASTAAPATVTTEGEAPKTGDKSKAPVAVLLLLISEIGIALSVMRRRRWANKINNH